DQVGASNVLPAQGRSGLFVVFDPNPDATGDCSTARDPDNGLMPRPVEYNTLCQSDEDPWVENPEGSIGEGVDGTGCLPSRCCEGIKHLCGLPLCPLCNDKDCPDLNLGDDRPIRQGPVSVRTDENDKVIPNCVPFEMPSLCCD
ncbi:MAG TPA: hypothetical protein VFZ61_10985, partial [Polyangiales bacterium]